MQKQKIFGFIFFAIFFGTGAAALVFAILSEELIDHWRNRSTLAEARQTNEKLRLLNDDYDELLAKIESNPELLERLAPAVLGTDSNEPNTVNPHFTPQQLQAARLALKEQIGQQHKELPAWLLRSNEPRRRLAILLAGAFLILVSFIWFGAAKNTMPRQKT
ncbi:MAG: hypothetical protein PHF37_03355 [Phycisphaerae bacterium]|nr:hypothetical protein [Phycisphaerae bacterium]